MRQRANTHAPPARSVDHLALRLAFVLAILAATVVANTSAGDAATTVRVVNGRLLITGDNSRQDVTISTVSLATGSYLVEVNLEPTVVVEGVDAMTIRLRGDNDRVRIFDAGLPGDLVVDLGTGNDEFLVDNSEFRRNLTVNGSNQVEVVRIQRTIVDGRTNLRLRNGDDTVVVRGGEFGPFTVTPGGTGVNGFIVEGSPLFHRAANLRGGRHRDFFYLGQARFESGVALRTGNGDDEVQLGQIRSAGLIADLGSGNDELLGRGEVVDGRLTIRAGSGDDLVSLANGNNDDLLLQAGSGDDEVELDSVFFGGNIDVRLDGGNDDLRLVGNGFTDGISKLNGGSGIDALAEIDWRFERSPVIIAFENQ
ncbi:MAG: hypothetical protein AAF531_06875 [Actinomycetota bacterium]